VIGAAHRRRQVVCQDFSLVRTLLAPSGGRLQLLAVADGHGGERYRCSDSGSRLACEQAAEVVEVALQSAPLDHLPTWERLLAEGLPDAIQTRWLQAIQLHWQQQQQFHEGNGDRQLFCSSLYGSTLGLLLLAPTWWGCTGLGDWDLVRVGGGGNRLLSEEAELPGTGEATASLCLSEARTRWVERAQLQAIPASCPPFALLISTDGVRKSCATDGDFLELCSQMVGIQDPRQLEEGLAEISAAGSGDDLSIAVGRWLPAAGQTPGPRRAVTLPVVSRPPGVPLALLLLVPVGLAMGAAAWWARPTDPLPVIQNEAERLCRDPGLIAGTLTQRRQQFSQLRNGSSDRQLLLARAAQDPLGALIAWSRPALPPPPVAEPSQGTMSSSRSEQPFPLPASCPALDQALALQWRNILKSVSEPVYPPPAPVP
jgi:hypothetical protein